MTMARAVHEAQRATRDDAIVVTGAGLPQGMVKQRWVTRQPRTHLTSGGFSTMGFTLPAAIGAQLAHATADGVRPPLSRRQPPAIAPLGEALPNTEIFRRLAARIGMTRLVDPD